MAAEDVMPGAIHGPRADAPTFRPRHRPGYVVRPHTITWDVCVFTITATSGAHEGTSVYTCVDGYGVARWLHELEAGLFDAEFRAALGRPPQRCLTRLPRTVRQSAASCPPRVGVEHEFTVRDARSHLPVDFAAIIHGLDLDGVRADPVDPHAYRCAWGGVITRDGREAEIATPPVEIAPGLTTAVRVAAERGRSVLDDALVGRWTLEGYSTHVNVSARSGVRRIARIFARTFAPAFMLLLERTSSPGLLVRPRPGRLELCGEFTEGAGLESVVAFAAGSVIAIASARRAALRALAVRVDISPAVQRYGWYVDRRAFGPDLYREGRAASLAGRDGPVTAQHHLERAWHVARAALAPVVTAHDLAATDAMVAGRLPLPSEETA